jgi:hypothetical protein
MPRPPRFSEGGTGDYGARIKTAVPSMEQKNCCGEDTQLQPLFRVTLRAQPSNAAIAVHPVISISFVFQASDFPGADARILSNNTPVVLRVSDDFECHFCFCHELLCMFFCKMEPLASRQVALTAREDPYLWVRPDEER